MSKKWVTISNGSDKSYFKIDNLSSFIRLVKYDRLEHTIVKDAEMIICKDDINDLMLALKEVQIREEK